jgi:uncharacterized membrane protein
MTWPSLVWGSPDWLAVTLALSSVALLVLAWSYSRARAGRGVRLACAGLKAVGFAALALCLLEPLLTGTKPRQGANSFAVVADNSQSLRIRDQGSVKSRADWIQDQLAQESKWGTRLEQDFEVRRYSFDSHLKAVDGFGGLAFDGIGSSLETSLTSLSSRFRGLPLAGVLLVTDGNSTEATDVDWSKLPPIYPLIPPSSGVARDIGIADVAVSQTNFESAPVVLRADVDATGFRGQQIVAVVVDESGEEVERQKATPDANDKTLSFRFQFRPIRRGVHFYKVRAFAASDEPAHSPDADPSASVEQTLANNARLLVVDQGGGTDRVLYVGGRPNWEFKFLNRAIEGDEQVQLVGLLRVARSQPKFDFQAQGSRSSSLLYKGFENPDDETAERYDEAVLVRINTLDETELRDGFPRDAADLYQYEAIILDDVEASFFRPDQLALIRSFVSTRGGGLLMLGGPDSFSEGRYDRTPVGDLLPVYLNRSLAEVLPQDVAYRLDLSREGWLQPWVRTRKTEDEERKRLATMPAFQTLTHAGMLKPGAVVLAEARDPEGAALPALAAQSFGQGRVAALLIGDLWRWGLRRETPDSDDFERAWRQTIRWLVADVPKRVELSMQSQPGLAAPAVLITVRVRDAEYQPLDNSRVQLRIRVPDGTELTLDAEPEDREPGAYSSTYVMRQPGPYRFFAKATAPDGEPIGEVEAGWAAQPAADEFKRLEPNRTFLEEIARKTGGEVVEPDHLESFVASLQTRRAPINEPWTSPLWNHPLYFLIAIVCLAAEWGLRRVHGLA